MPYIYIYIVMHTLHPPAPGTVPHPHHTFMTSRGGGGQYYGWPMTMAEDFFTQSRWGAESDMLCLVVRLLAQHRFKHMRLVVMPGALA